ncbi:MAG: formate/nitrite transporter family protein [Erysipelotrichaceae bacterium]|nr:formate/nitrite transporter family protein [Erysipelotrichaceae bacterium]
MKKELKIMLESIAAGMMIGVGAISFLSAESKIVSSFLFVIGMFTICTFKLNLFTGKVCYIPDNKPSYLWFVTKVWIGNFIGTYLVAVLLKSTRLNNSLITKAQSLVDAKINDSLLSLLILGIFCGILIYVTVDNYAKNPHEIGKYAAVFMGVMVFLMCGFEHSVADMFYFSFCSAWNLNTLIRILIISLGNIIGGCLLPILRSIKADA